MIVDIWGKKMTPKEVARDMVQVLIQDAYMDVRDSIADRCEKRNGECPTEREIQLIIDQYEKYLVRAAEACGYDKWTSEQSAKCDRANVE
jgi:hypothetical protein|tara:strand:+ start:768 stop:1037 length:270 start_codon:yes stop_codon:yes gene_type:complete